MNKYVTEKVIGVSKSSTFILEEVSYEFCDDIWNIIKDFAGIYNIQIEWDKIKLRNEYHLLKEYINIYRYNITQKEFKKDESRVRKLFWMSINNMNGFMFINKTYKITTKKTILNDLSKYFATWTLPTDFNVGDEIQFPTDNRRYRAGIIISIANDRKSYKIKEYTCKHIGNRNDNYDFINIYDWDKTNTTISTIKSDKKIKKDVCKFEYTVYFN